MSRVGQLDWITKDAWDSVKVKIRINKQIRSKFETMLPMVTNMYVHDGANEDSFLRFGEDHANKCSV